MKKLRPVAHFAAAATAVVWGTTFVASSLLLKELTAAQLVLVRFAISYAVLWLLSIGRKSPKITLKNEIRFLLLGLFGVTGYQLLENFALQHTSASNVGIIVAAAPIFTAILAHLFTRDEKISAKLVIGSLAAFAGVALVSFNGTVVLKLSPLGDCIALGAAISWAIYGIILKSLVEDADPVTLTRRTMFYGLLLAIPAVIAEGQPLTLSGLLNAKMLIALGILALLGSAVCYVVWNFSTKILGTVITTNYIYVSPFVTMVVAYFVLGDAVTPMGLIGAVLIIAGVVIASMKGKRAESSRQTEGE